MFTLKNQVIISQRGGTDWETYYCSFVSYYLDGTKPVGPQLMEKNFDQSVIEDWVYRVPQISIFLSVVIRQGLHVLHSVPDQTKDILNLVPACKGIKRRGLVSLFDIPSIIYINSHLPAELQHKWQLLFSSRLHGESFSQLCGHIVNKGPCIVILKDLDGYIFGGFASHSWEVKPQFQGKTYFSFVVSRGSGKHCLFCTGTGLWST